jgi:MoaA/NifB/PqqE/SkfB family radical SAM enzyme
VDPPATVLVWRATERCDTACAFCAYDVRLRRARRELDEAEATRFGRLAADWAGRGRLLVSWLGGEPFLWRPLARVSAALARAGARVALTTNGRALAEPAWRDFVLGGLDELTVSIDGLPAIHDELRGRAGAGEALFDALAGLRRERRGERPLLRVNTVVMRRNVGSFAAFARRVAEAGADELTFNALGGADRPEFFPDNHLRPDDVDQLAEMLASLGGLRVRGAPGYLARLGAAARGEAVAVDDCGPGRRFWFGEVDGTLAPCSFAAGALGVSTRELRTPADLDALPARFAAARRRARPASCDDCPSTQVHAKWS